MRILRTFLALLITPFIAPLAGLLVHILHRGGLPPAYVFRTSLKYYLIIAFVLTTIVGVPAFLLLRLLRFGGKLSAAVCGGLIAFATGYALFELVPYFFTTNNVEGYITWSLTGALSGLVLWVIATGRETDKERPTHSLAGPT